MALEDEVRKQTEALNKLLSEMSGSKSKSSSLKADDSTNPLKKTTADIKKEMTELQNQIQSSNENIDKLNKNGWIPSRKALENAAKKQSEFDSNMERNSEQMELVQKSLKQLEGETDAASNAKRAELQSGLAKLQAEKKSIDFELNKRDLLANSTSAVSNAFNAYAGVMGQAMSAWGGVIAAAQSTGSGFGLLGAAANYAATMQNAYAQMAASATTQLGDSLQKLGGVAGFAGTALSLLGNMASQTAKLQQQAAEMRNSLFMQSGEKFAKSFMTATAAGALFTHGADGMNNAIKDSRLLLGDLGDIIKENKDKFGKMGMSMEDAVTQIGRVGTNLKKSGVDQQLMRLGFSFKDQAGLMADVMADMQRVDPNKAMTDNEIAQATKQYAKDLTTIAAITGQDAKTRMEAARKMNDTLFMQQQIYKLSEQYGPKYKNAMDTMVGAFSPEASGQMQKDLSDMLANNGKIVNQQGNAMAQVSPAYQAMMNELYEASKNGTASADKAAQIQAKYGAAIQKQVMSAEAIGKASQVTDGYSRQVAQNLNAISKIGQITPKKVEDAEKKNEQQAGKGPPPKDKLGTAIVDTAVMMNDFQKKMDNYVIKHLPDWTNAVIKSLKKMEQAYEGFVPGTGMPKWLEKVTEFLAKYGMAIMLGVEAFKILSSAMNFFGKDAKAAGEQLNNMGKEAAKGSKKYVESVDKNGKKYYHEEGNKMARVSKSAFEEQGKGGLKAAWGNMSKMEKVAGVGAVVGNLVNAAQAYDKVMDKQKAYEAAKKSGDKEGMAAARSEQGEAAGSAVGSMAGGAIGMMLGGPIGAAVGSYLGEMAGGMMGKYIGPYWDDISATAGKMWDDTKASLSKMGANASQVVSGLWTSTTNLAASGSKAFMDATAGIRTGLSDAARTFFDFIVKVPGFLWEGIKKSPIFQIGTFIWEAIKKSPLGGIATWMTGLITSVFDKIKQIGADALDWIGGKLKALNPASWFGGGDDKKEAKPATATPKPADAANAKPPAPTTGAAKDAQNKAQAPAPAPAPPVKTPELSKTSGALTEKDMPRLLDDNRKLMEALLKQNQAMAGSLSQIAQSSNTSARAAEKMVRNTS